MIRRIDVRTAGFPPADGLPGIVLGVRDGRGRWDVMRRHAASLAGSTLLIRATTRHFSTVAAIDSGVRVTLDPGAVERFVGETARVKVSVDGGRDPNYRAKHNWNPGGGVFGLQAVGSDDGAIGSAIYSCHASGTGSYAVLTRVEDYSIERAFVLFAAQLGFGDQAYEFTLRGAAVCKGAPPATRVTDACAVTSHQPFGLFPSSLRFRLALSGPGAAGATVILTVAGVNGGLPIIATADSSGRVEIEGGIGSFGAKAITRAVVAGRDLTAQVVSRLGPAVNVTATEGVAAGACP